MSAGPDRRHGDAQLESLRLELRVGFSKIDGKLETLAAVHSGERDQLRTELSNERHARRKLEKVVDGMLDRIDAYPKPLEVAKTAELARANQLTLGKLITAVIAAGGAGGAAGQLLRGLF